MRGEPDQPIAKTDRLGVRTTPRQRFLLSEASEVEGTSVSEFVLRHATRAAENVLADRRVFMLTDERWNAFTEALDRPAQERPRLRKLLDTPTVLDEG